MKTPFYILKKRQSLVIIGILFGIISMTRFYSFLFFHILAEFFSIIIALLFCVFMLNSLDLTKIYGQNLFQINFFHKLGIGTFFFVILDLLHTIAYRGMNIFIGFDSNLPTQLWIAARYFQAITLITSIFLADKKINLVHVFFVDLGIIILILFSIFDWKNFPVCYVEGEGLTIFKIISEYVIILLLGITNLLIWKKRTHFIGSLSSFLIISIILMIFSEICFTLYVGVFEISNYFGHLFKLIAYIFLYLIVIEIAIKKPYRDLITANNAKNDFISNMSHELRTPLTSIMGFAQLLSMDEIIQRNPTHREYLDIINQSTTHLLNIINQILDIGKIEKNLLRTEIENCDIIEMIQLNLKQFTTSINEKQLTIIMKTMEPLIIPFGRTHLIQIFFNIIGNAIKFSNQNGLIEIEFQLNLDHIIVSIRDTGEGISIQDQNHLFEKFFQSNLQMNKIHQGTGIGLYYTKMILTQYHGKIWIESELKKGTCVYVQFQRNLIIDK